MPNLINDFDCVGFAHDFTLVKYKEDNLIKLLVEMHMDDLVSQCGYPKELLYFEYEKDLAGLAFKNAVFDIDNGTILKLGQNLEVLGAQRGYEHLKED